MEINLLDLKNIKIGDWVESSYLKGYFQVYRIKHCYRNGENIGWILLLKKLLTPAIKFSIVTEKCHAAWCTKLSTNKICEIKKLLEDNPKQRKKFEELPPLYPCIQQTYFLNIDKEEIDMCKAILNQLPKYFTKKQFDSLAKNTGLIQYMMSNSDDPKNAITLTIYTQEWMVDSKNNTLYCNPQVGNMWGKLAKLNVEEWNDFHTVE